MKKLAIAFIIFASSLAAQVQLGKNVQIGSSGSATITPIPADMELPLTEGAGTVARDISGHGNDATFGANAPTWSSSGLRFNGGLVAAANQTLVTPLNTWRSLVMNICPDPLPQTSGLTTFGIFYSKFPTIWGTSVNSTGILLLSGSSAANTYQGAWTPSIYSNNTATFNTTVPYGNFGCFNIGYTLGASDHIYINGVEVGSYGSQGATSASATVTGGVYTIGGTGYGTANGFDGYINYVAAYSTTQLTAAQQLQESNYINQQLAQRFTFPPVPHIPYTSRVPTINFIGDSLTAGLTGSGVWTSHVDTSLMSTGYTINNWGLASDEAATASSSIPYRAGNNISAQAKNYDVVWLGTNDCADGGYTATQIWGNLNQIATTIRSLGGTPVVATMVSRTGQDGCKDALNPLIRAYYKQAGYVGLLDLAENPNLGADGAYANATYFNGGLHLTGGNACGTSTGYGLACVGATNVLSYLDGYTKANPFNTTATSLTIAANEGYIVANPASAASYTLPDCSFLTDAIFSIVNTSANVITVSTTGGQTLYGVGSIAGSATGDFKVGFTGDATGGCYWTQNSSGSSSFALIVGGTNTTAAMVVGSGASLAPTGTGTIRATNIANTVAATSPINVTGSGTVSSPYTFACPTCGTGTGGTSVSQNSGSAETNLPITGFMPQACSDISGSGTAQTCSTANTFIPQAKNCIVYNTTTTNSGTGLTVNVNSLGAKSVAIPGSSGWTTTLTASIIPANKPINMCYDGTNWNVQQTGTVATSTGGLTQISKVVVSSPVSTITFSSIPGTYSALKIVFMGQESNAAAQSLIVNFNSDTAANYDYQYVGSSSANSSAVSSPFIGNLPPVNATGAAAIGEMVIPGYAGTTFWKTIQSLNGDVANTTTLNYVTNWRSTAAITRIDFTLSSAANFSAGTTFTLYGMQ